ncbi:endonuclease MutS2 [Gorillibacterium sp. sgz5001074]|uniref:endonuclease MutS2 n=1 Tax=Gorillibacterium sp. sgz5001074 TaxID=3446695 RepID=UPI003F66B7C5
MKESMLLRLEYHKVTARLAEYTVSDIGRRTAEGLTPSSMPGQIQARLDEAEEALDLYHRSSSIPLPSMEGMEWVLGHLGKGYVLAENDFASVLTFLRSVSQLKRFMSRWESVSPSVSLYARSLRDYSSLAEELERSIRNGRVADAASPELSKVRKMIMVQEERLKKKLDSILNKHKKLLQETIISQRNGRYVIPVKKEHRKLLPGTVLDESSSGQTVFIEPAELAVVQTEMNELRFQESMEEQKVLARLTELVEQEEYAIRSDMETVGHYDFLFAKAKLATDMGARSVRLNEEGRIVIRQGRHPLLGSKMVPLDFAIGGDCRALMITGPNTGGKTVALKTVGLLTLMVQSGMLVPVQEGSEFSVFRAVEADIGDGQSLEHSLSTFSAHVKQLITILGEADAGTLILLDELATGTDPGEGIGLSIAVLEELYRRGATIIATTHYNEIKDFAAVTPGFRNARMEFDTETLSPLYRLTIGEAGSSYAFQIALKLGMDPAVIERSKEITGAKARNTDVFQVPPPSTAPGTLQKRTQPGRKDGSPKREQEKERMQQEFAVGDSVWIHPLKRAGIVYRAADEKGMVVVQVKKEKLVFNRKRLAPYIPKEELYPGADYDLDIVFESVDVRKARKQMGKRHVEGLQIEQNFSIDE